MNAPVGRSSFAQKTGKPITIVPYGQFHCFTIFSVLIKGCWDAAKEKTQVLNKKY